MDFAYTIKTQSIKFLLILLGSIIFVFLLLPFGESKMKPLVGGVSYSVASAQYCPPGYEYRTAYVPPRCDKVDSGLQNWPNNTPSFPTQEAANNFRPNLDAAGPSWWDDPVGAFLAVISNIILALFGWLLGMAGIVLNFAIMQFVNGMGFLVYNQSGGAIGRVIEDAWRIVRDFVNITFVFGLIYAGLLTILEKGETKKLIVSIILGAFLVNFSLYFAKIIIDVSNIATVEIYELIAKNGGAISGDLTGLYSGGISGVFLEKMGVIPALGTEGAAPNTDVFSRIANINTAESRGFVQVILLSFLMLVAAFSFFAGAILLLMRFVALILLMIFSPVAFLVHLPKLPDWSNEWWGKMINNAIFAPAYLFMLWIALLMINKFTLGSGTLVGAFGGDTPQFAAILNFIIICLFLLGAIKVAKEMGIMGQNFATRTAGRLTFGLTGALGRSSLGRAGTYFSNKESLKEAAAKWGVTGFMARRALGASRLAAKSSTVKDQLGVDWGEARRGGHEARVKDIKKKEGEYAKSFGTYDVRGVKAVSKIDDSDENIEALKQQIESEERFIRDRKIAKEGAETAGEKRRIERDIQNAEARLKKVRENIELERSRRQTGGIAGAAAVEAAKKADGHLKNTIKELEEAKKMRDDEIARGGDVAVAKELVAEYDAKVAAAKSAVKEAQRRVNRSTGYSGVVRGSGTIVSMSKGSNRAIGREAGDSIRNAYAKKAKRSKEERGTDEIKEAIEASKKSEEK